MTRRPPSVVVVDYGSGNLRSAERALARAGADVTVTEDRDAAREADGVVIPGVGAFAACMDGIRKLGIDALVHTRVAKERPVLGICVGMQVLYQSGEEHGVTTSGIGTLPGRVERLRAPILPHLGWNTVTPPDGSRLFAGVAGERFYFVHSYAAAPAGSGETIAVHGSPFVAAVERGVLTATQFHPEKSGDAGHVLLQNWVRSL
ncbi:MAG TPA: imidazole glycerol phosphate synthase subunit HisH [Mycobacteriales bacterium]|jgi:glutamine amidotransferase|nr:imidazole glycerol phosphate synthase subunit HisH [Mycobacteriales bacterium]